MIRPTYIMMTMATALCTYAGATAALEEMPVSQKLAPMERPAAFKVGDEWYGVRKGKTKTEVVTAVNGDAYTAKDTNGCVWTSLTWAFAPSLEWSGCPGYSDGKQEITKTKGSPWPMKLKNKFSYSFRGSDKAESWRSTRTCKVKKQVRVKIAAGEFDTYKLVCRDQWSSRTYWISPEIGDVVAFKNKNGILEMTKP